MKTIDFYLDKARENQGLKSDRDLCKALGLSNGAITQIRTGRSWPSDETMVSLAKLADVTPEQALLELSYWRAEGEARETYKGLLKRIGVTAATVSLGVFLISGNALAAAPTVTRSVADCILWK